MSRSMIGQVSSKDVNKTTSSDLTVQQNQMKGEIQRVRRFRPRSDPVAPLPEVPLLSRPSFFEQSSQYQVGGRGFATFTQGRWN